nr:hypothetical protein [Nitrosomonas nitrosa]
MTEPRTPPVGLNISETDRSALRFFCRHLVGLCVTYRHRDSGHHEHLRFAAYSGTLIRVGDSILFLTAGHVLREVEAARQSAGVEIRDAVLADTFGLRSASGDQPIPFDLLGARLFYIDDEAAGLDFGVIVLSPYYVRLLAANGMVALEEDNWRRQHTVQFDGYAMLGFPEEFTSQRVDALGAGLVSPTMLSVRRLEVPPEGTPPTTYPRFIGEIDRRINIQSIRGMSGGPIFGFRLSPDVRYWVVAIQSSWLPSQRVVFGCSLPILASLMTEWEQAESSAL